MATTDASSIELNPQNRPNITSDPGDIAESGPATAHEASHEFLLPPVDGGKDAWLFLAAAFAIEALVWGFPFAFGIFQEYYSTHEPFAGSANIAVIGTCSMGIMYLSGPLVILTLRLFPQFTRFATVGGLLIMCLSLALSSLSRTTTQLIATQGVLYALGGGLAYCPCILHMDGWFVRRKGLAYGIMWSGTGLAGVLLPLLLESLLARFGWQTTLRVWAAVLFVVTAPLSWFVKPRVPVTTTYWWGRPAAAADDSDDGPRPPKPWNLSFLLDRTFALHQLANVAEATGFFLPGIYLPSYARSALGARAFPEAALTVLLLNVASVFGCVAMGWLIDRLHVTTCIVVSTAGAAAGAFLLWGLADGLPALYAFCVVYGLFAGSFSSTWPGIMRDVAARARERQQQEGGGNGGARGRARGGVDPSMVFGCLAAGRGIGNVISGPLSEALVKGGMEWRGHAALGYGSGYGSLIVFTGVTALLGGASFLWRRIGWL